MNPPAERRALAIASDQAGVVTRRQAMAAGMTHRMIQTRLNCGLWRRIEPGIYAVHDIAPAIRPLAVAVAKLPAVVSHESAGELHGFGYVPRGRVVVTVRHRSSNRCLGVTVHESTDLAPEHIDHIDQLPATTPIRTVLDLAATTKPKRYRRLLDDVLASGRIELGELRDLFESVGRRGKPGTAMLREIIGQIGPDDVAPESELERRLHELLASADMAPPVLQLPLPWRTAAKGRIDFAYPQHRLLIECDGRRWHTRADAFEADRRRDNLAQLAGWRVLRFTWEDVTSRPVEVLDAVTEALAVRVAPLPA